MLKRIAAMATALILASCAQGQQVGGPSQSANAESIIDQLLPAPSYVADNRPGNIGPLRLKPGERRRFTMAMAGVDYPFIGEGFITQVADGNGNIVVSTFLNQMRVQARGLLYPVDMRGILFQRHTMAPDGNLIEVALIDYDDLSGEIKKPPSPYVSQENWTATLKAMFNRRVAIGATLIDASSTAPFPDKPVSVGTTYVDRSGDAFYSFAGDAGLKATFRSAEASGAAPPDAAWSSTRLAQLPPDARTQMARDLFSAMKIQNPSVRGKIDGRVISAACDCVKIYLTTSFDQQVNQANTTTFLAQTMFFDPQLGFVRMAEVRTTAASSTQVMRTVVE